MASEEQKAGGGEWTALREALGHLQELLSAATVRFTRDHGEPNPSLAIPYEVVFACEQWNRVLNQMGRVEALAAAPSEPPALAEKKEPSEVGETLPQQTEMLIRMFLWDGHGHQGIYGDDGEMQCGECGVDYKRDALNVCVEKARVAALQTGLKKLAAREVGEPRCNYYFGGHNGGNRCQRAMGHHDDLGHLWVADKEVAAPVGEGLRELINEISEIADSLYTTNAIRSRQLKQLAGRFAAALAAPAPKPAQPALTLDDALNVITYFFDTHKGEILKSGPVCETLCGRLRRAAERGREHKPQDGDS